MTQRVTDALRHYGARVTSGASLPIPKNMSFPKKLIAPLSALAILATSLSAPAAEETEDNTNYGQVAMYVAAMLENRHYSRRDIDDEVSKQLLDAYLGYLDFNRLYFTEGDVAGFKEKYATKLDSYLKEDGDISPALEIYNIYKKRVTSRVGKIKEFLDGREFTFEGDETVERRRKDSPWPKNEADADAIWSRMIENQLLEEELARITKEKALAEKAAEAPKEGEAEKKPEAPAKEEETPKQKIVDRYERFLKSLDDNDEEDICNLFLSSLASLYDPHSEYFSHSEMDNFNVNMGNHLFGIGALLRLDAEEGSAKIEGLVVGGPAEKGGELQINDRIVGVGEGADGKMVDVMYMKLGDIVELIRGEEGSVVRLKVIPAEAADDSMAKEIIIVRARVDLKDKLANAEVIETLDAKGDKTRIGWIYLDSFYLDMEDGSVSTTRDVRRLLDRLVEKEGISGLVLDLRGNGGGSLEEAINLTGLFIKKGPVVLQKDWKGKESSRSSTNRWPVYEGPMIVLTDRNSASASEILAAALQDYNRALIVGDKSTFGKGTVQTIIPVAQFMPLFLQETRAGALKVTIQKFYRISGGSTQKRGVIPDVILPSFRDALETGEESLEHCLEYDEINRPKYSLFSDEEMPKETLNERMKARIAQNPEFQYTLEDTARIKEEYDRNEVSLNLEKRLADNEKIRASIKERNAARRVRFAQIEEEEKGKLNVYKLTLDNVEDESLPLAKDFDQSKLSGMIQNPEEEDDLDDTPEYPDGFDPMKRETLNVMQDFIDLTNAKKTAQVTPRAEAPAVPN